MSVATCGDTLAPVAYGQAHSYRIHFITIQREPWWTHARVVATVWLHRASSMKMSLTRPPYGLTVRMVIWAKTTPAASVATAAITAVLMKDFIEMSIARVLTRGGSSLGSDCGRGRKRAPETLCCETLESSRGRSGPGPEWVHARVQGTGGGIGDPGVAGDGGAARCFTMPMMSSVTERISPSAAGR